eukprot:13809970-Alexandrium_andersonii.AAC.1
MAGRHLRDQGLLRRRHLLGGRPPGLPGLPGHLGAREGPLPQDLGRRQQQGRGHRHSRPPQP